MSRVDKILRLTCAYFLFNLKGSLAFPTSFVFQVFSMVFNDAIWVAFWVLYFARFPVVQGWHRTDILVLWGISAVAFGVMDVVFGNTLQLGRLISEGEMDIYLSLPKAPMFHALISRQNVVGFGDILFGFVTLSLSLPHHFWTLLEALIGIIASALLLIGFVVMAQSLVFFIGGREGIGGQLSEAFLAFSHYPNAIFHGTLIRILIFGVMPAGFINSLPSGIVDGVHPWMIGAALIVGILEVALARWVFYRGLRIYSSGNRITVRV